MAARSASFSSGFDGVSIQIIRVVRADRLAKGVQIGRIDVAEIEIRRAPPHPLEQPVRAAVQIVADQHVRAVVQQLQHGADRRPGPRRRRSRPCRFPDRPRSARRRTASGCGCGRSRIPCARPAIAARRCWWRRSASSRRRSSDRATGRRGSRGWQNRARRGRARAGRYDGRDVGGVRGPDRGLSKAMRRPSACILALAAWQFVRRPCCRAQMIQHVDARDQAVKARRRRPRSPRGRLRRSAAIVPAWRRGDRFQIGGHELAHRLRKAGRMLRDGQQQIRFVDQADDLAAFDRPAIAKRRTAASAGRPRPAARRARR